MKHMYFCINSWLEGRVVSKTFLEIDDELNLQHDIHEICILLLDGGKNWQELQK